MVLIASSTFWPSRRTPKTTSSEIEVALRSSRTRTTVPSRIKRTTSSLARLRLFQASQSVRIFLHVRANHVLAHRAAEQGRQRTLDPTRVGAGQVGTRDQRLDLAGHPGVAGQRRAAPFLAAAAGRHPGARHAHRPRASPLNRMSRGTGAHASRSGRPSAHLPPARSDHAPAPPSVPAAVAPR